MLKIPSISWLLISRLLVAVLWLTSCLGYPAHTLAAELPIQSSLIPTTERSSSPPEPLEPSRPNHDSSAISSEKVSQFVSAYLQVLALIERREGELRSAETTAESRQLEQDIQAQAFAIIEQAGLTRQEYLQLLGLANTDPEFSDRIIIQLQEAQP